MLISLIFSVIGLGVALLFLPLRLFRAALGLVLLPVRIVVKLLTRNLFLLALLVIGILIYRAVDSSNATLPELTPAPAAAPTIGSQLNKPQAPTVIEPVRTTEDGDSSFATDLYAQMTEPERAQYSAQYYYAMSTVPDGQAYAWTSGNIGGTLRPNSSFTNKSGVRCRSFSEVLKVHAVQQTVSGTACEQGSGAWCKLKPNATPACNLGGYSPGIIDGILNLF